MKDDDDDIRDLEDYLIQKDPPYYVNEDEERSKERRCKLLGIPYVKPPTCKSKKLEKRVLNLPRYFPKEGRRMVRDTYQVKLEQV
nr:hypothetical protein [Tanacetum cinerariifolium]